MKCPSEKSCERGALIRSARSRSPNLGYCSTTLRSAPDFGSPTRCSPATRPRLRRAVSAPRRASVCRMMMRAFPCSSIAGLNRSKAPAGAVRNCGLKQLQVSNVELIMETSAKRGGLIERHENGSVLCERYIGIAAGTVLGSELPDRFHLKDVRPPERVNLQPSLPATKSSCTYIVYQRGRTRRYRSIPSVELKWVTEVGPE